MLNANTVLGKVQQSLNFWNPPFPYLEAEIN